MADTITWSVTDLRRDSNDKVVQISYKVERKKDGVSYAPTGVGEVNIEGDVTIPFADLTQAKAVEWAKDALGSDGVATKEAELEQYLLSSGLPWTS
jgi:hypothetical protein